MAWLLAVHLIASTYFLGVASTTGPTCDGFPCAGFPAIPDDIAWCESDNGLACDPEAEDPCGEDDDGLAIPCVTCIPEEDRRLRAGLDKDRRLKNKQRRLERKQRRLHEPEPLSHVAGANEIAGNTSELCCEKYLWMTHCMRHCFATTIRDGSTDDVEFDDEAKAKKECAERSDCWGIMLMGCGTDQIFLCSDETADQPLSRSWTQGTCTLQKVTQAFVQSIGDGRNWVGLALRPSASYVVVMLLTLWTLAGGVGHA